MERCCVSHHTGFFLLIWLLFIAVLWKWILLFSELNGSHAALIVKNLWKIIGAAKAAQRRDFWYWFLASAKQYFRMLYTPYCKIFTECESCFLFKQSGQVSFAHLDHLCSTFYVKRLIEILVYIEYKSFDRWWDIVMRLRNWFVSYTVKY